MEPSRAGRGLGSREGSCPKKIASWSPFSRMRRRGVVMLLVMSITQQGTIALPSGRPSELGSTRPMALRGGFSQGFPQGISPRKLFPKETYGEGELELGNSFEQVLDTVCKSHLVEGRQNSSLAEGEQGSLTEQNWNFTLSAPSSPSSSSSCSSSRSRRFIMPPKHLREIIPTLVDGKVPKFPINSGGASTTARQHASARFSAWIRDSRDWIRDSRDWIRAEIMSITSAAVSRPARHKASPRFSDAGGPGFALAGSIIRTVVREGLFRSAASLVAGIFGATATMVVLFTAAERGVPMLMMDEGNLVLQWLAAVGGFLASLIAGVCVAAVRPQYPVTHATVLGIFYTSARVANLMIRPGEEHPLWAILQVACYIPGFYLSAVGYAQSPISCSCFYASSPNRRVRLQASKAVSPESLVDALAAKKLARIALSVAVAAAVIGTIIPGP